jgi:hypothetical protein
MDVREFGRGCLDFVRLVQKVQWKCRMSKSKCQINVKIKMPKRLGAYSSLRALLDVIGVKPLIFLDFASNE